MTSPFRSARLDGSLTRRRFLYGSGAAATMMLLGGRFGRAQEPGAPSETPVAPQSATPETATDGAPRFTFAMASDSHIGAAKKTSKYTQQWATTVEEINEFHPAFTLFLGDLVDFGEKPEHHAHYATWMETAKKLTAPWLAVPGNHDPVEVFQKYIAKETDAVHDHQGLLRAITFHDAQPNPKHDATATPAQIEWLDRAISEAPGSGKNVILASHVVFHKNGPPDRAWYMKEGRTEFEVLLKKHQSRIFAMFTGHYHNGLRGWNDLGIHEVMMPAVCYNLVRIKGKSIPEAIQEWTEKGGGFVLPEFRPGWIQAEVYVDRMVLKYKPLGAVSDAQKVLANA
ncbi:MAG: metallophosphoesterase [Verrucomicrobiae bacterium]|nr:metallophosphoesterase [Verrucomicrobiae bacterium]